MIVKTPTPQEIESTKVWGIWEKEPSKFDWEYSDKETCYILEGKAEVTDKKGNTITFKAGDWVEFEAGLECVWNITEAIKKRYNFG